MTWIRVDDHFADHPKVMALGRDRLAGLGLWHVAAAYCSRYLTDGFVPAALLESQAPKRLAARMAEVGLFTVCENGYQLHDWLEYNPARTRVLAERKAAKERMSRARSQEVPPNVERTSPEPNLPRTRIPVPVSQVLKEVSDNGTFEEQVEPSALYLARTRRKTLSQKERDWIEDLHARFSRKEVVMAMRIVPEPRTSGWLKRVDDYLEQR